MYRYTAFSLTIESELELPELEEGTDKPDVFIRLGRVSRQQQPATIADEIAFPLNIGRFHIKGGREIIVELVPDYDPFVLQAMLQGRLMAYLLRQRGWLPLHASGVSIDGQCVLFLGESGAGKSTTAAAFYARGHSVLTDDVAAVRNVAGGVELRTAGSGLRLLGDARKVIQERALPSAFRNDKHVYRLARFTSVCSIPVKGIYFLEYGADNQLSVRREVIAGSSAAALLNSHSFLRPWRAGSDLLQINLDRSASIAAAIPVWHLVRPRSLDSLPELVNFIEKDVTADE